MHGGRAYHDVHHVGQLLTGNLVCTVGVLARALDVALKLLAPLLERLLSREESANVDVPPPLGPEFGSLQKMIGEGYMSARRHRKGSTSFSLFSVQSARYAMDRHGYQEVTYEARVVDLHGIIGHRDTCQGGGVRSAPIRRRIEYPRKRQFPMQESTFASVYALKGLEGHDGQWQHTAREQALANVHR